MSKFDELTKRVTDRMVSEIERLNADPEAKTWQMPWTATPGGLLQMNATTGKPYNGGNLLILFFAQEDGGFPTGEWATYKQWEAVGAQVRKGESGERLVRWVTVKRPSKTDPDKEVGRLVPKVFTVFNRAQVDGYEAEPVELSAVESAPLEPSEIVAQFVADTAAVIRYGQGQAFFRPAADYIGMPDVEDFDTAGDHDATLLHELVHWTAPRLGRKFDDETSMARYAREELVAELGAAILCARFDVAPSPRADHALYLGHWVKLLKEDPKCLFRTATMASKAVEHLDGYGAADELDDAPEFARAA